MRRIQFEISDEREVELRALAAEMNMSLKELLNNAFTLFKWAKTETQAGKIIASVDEISEFYCEVQMPCFTKGE